MPVYDFNFKPKVVSTLGTDVQRAPIGPQNPLPQQNREIEKTKIIQGTTNQTQKQEDIQPLLTAGFETMDRGMKEFFKDLWVPTKDDIRSPVTIRIAGGDKSFLYWRQDIVSGRVSIPVMSINRTNVAFNPQKFTPPYLPTRRRFNSGNAEKQLLSYRPWPCIISYDCTLWTIRKEDAEYINFQILRRFDPLAEIKVTDETGTGTMVIKFDGHVDSSDIDIGADDFAKVRYDYTFNVEGWLAYEEKNHNSILGKVATLNEFSGEIITELT